MKKKSLALWIFLGCIGVAMVAGAFAILFPGSVEDKVLATIFLVGAYSLGGLVVVAVGGRLRWTSRVCGLASVLSMSFFLFLIWFDSIMSYLEEEVILKAAFSLLVVGLVAGHRLVIWPLKTNVFMGMLLRRGALTFASLTGLMFVLAILVEDDLFWWDDSLVKTLGLLSLLASGASIGSGAFAIFGPKPGDDDPGLLGASMPVSMTCPRCQAAVEAQSNKDIRCQSCRLKIRVEIEEPRCGCGYLLYQLASDTCPECGKLISPDDQWAQQSDDGNDHDSVDFPEIV